MYVSPFSGHYDLVSPDGMIEQLTPIDPFNAEAIVAIEDISPMFKGFQIPLSLVFFNIKSTLAQLGLEGMGIEYMLEPRSFSARVKVRLKAIGPYAKQLLALLEPGSYIGKLFAADDRRRVRDPEYLTRMFGRADRDGLPLLSLGGLQGSNELVLEKIEGRAVAFLSLLPGCVTYDASIEGLLPTIAVALKNPKISTRDIVQIHQHWHEEKLREVSENDILLVKTLPLHVRTVFGRVVQELLPEGIKHTTASILQPDTYASGDIYELFGTSDKEINDIPLEFYTLEPYREYVFYADRDQLQACLDDPNSLFKAFDTAPAPHHHLCATFVVKGEQLMNLTPKDWVATNPKHNDFPGLSHPARQALMVERYIEEQPSFPFLRAIEDNVITSQGILLLRHFPSPLMKRMLLGDRIQRCLKAIYFEFPSLSYGDYFSHEDRSLLNDLAKFAIPVFWCDRSSGKILEYIPKPEKDTGMFVPLDKIDMFTNATSFGLYGSNLLEGEFENVLTDLLKGLLDIRGEFDHPLSIRISHLPLLQGAVPARWKLATGSQKNSACFLARTLSTSALLPKTSLTSRNRTPISMRK